MATKKAQVKKPYINFQVHWLNKQGIHGESGSWPKYAIEERLNTLHEEGYDVVDTHYIGDTPEAYGFVVILKLIDG